MKNIEFDPQLRACGACEYFFIFYIFKKKLYLLSEPSTLALNNFFYMNVLLVYIEHPLKISQNQYFVIFLTNHFMQMCEITK